MLRRPRSIQFLLLSACLALLAPAVLADPAGRTYEVTLTNITGSQIISPPLVVVHAPELALFRPGQPASAELAMLAEDGNPGPLQNLLVGLDGVYGVAVADGPILPGASAVVTITADGPSGVLSAVGMLVTTNDGFFGVRAPELPRARIQGGDDLTLVADAIAWDAGSEANTESCEHIPGPPCGSHEVRVTDGAEGFVSVHSGIHGIGDLPAATWDWRNPVVQVTVRRVN